MYLGFGWKTLFLERVIMGCVFTVVGGAGNDESATGGGVAVGGDGDGVGRGPGGSGPEFAESSRGWRIALSWRDGEGTSVVSGVRSGDGIHELTN